MIAAMLAYVGELNTRYPLIRTRNSTYTFFAKDTAFANSLGVQQQRRRIWHYLRSHWLANSVFPGLAEIMDACEMAWNRFATNPGLIRSLCAVTWDPASPAR
jgi:hypothetical protein